MPVTTVVVNSRDEGSAGAEYIGRGSPLGNPFPMGRGKDASRAAVILRYGEYADENPRLLELMKAMRGKRIRCFCAPEACHGDVVGFIAEGIETSAAAAARRVVAGETLAVYAARRENERGSAMSVDGDRDEGPSDGPKGIDFSKLSRPRSPEERAADQAASDLRMAAIEERERRSKVKYARAMSVTEGVDLLMGRAGAEVLRMRGKDEKGRPLTADFEVPFGYEREDARRLADSVGPGSRLRLEGYFIPHTNASGGTSFTMAVMFMDGEGVALKGRVVEPRRAEFVELPLTGPSLGLAAWRAAREDQANLPEPVPSEIRVAVASLSRVREEADRDGHRYVAVEGSDVATGVPVTVRVDSGFEAAIETVRATVSASPDGVVSVSGHWTVGPPSWIGEQDASFAALKVNGFDVARLSGVDNGRTETLDFQVRNLPPAVVASRYADAASFQAVSGGASLRGAEGLAGLADILPLEGGVVAVARIDVARAAEIEAARSSRRVQEVESFRESAQRPTMLLASKAEVDLARRALDPSSRLTREDLDALVDADPERRSPAAQSKRIVDVLIRTGHAVAQPEFAQNERGGYEKTGRVVSGPEGLASISSDFGRMHMRNVYLDPVALNRAVASMEPQVAGAFVAATERALADSAARRADKELVSGRAIPSSRRAEAGVGV